MIQYSLNDNIVASYFIMTTYLLQNLLGCNYTVIRENKGISLLITHWVDFFTSLSGDYFLTCFKIMQLSVCKF